jgi:uncharacterized protein (TIGR02246 family)
VQRVALVPWIAWLVVLWLPPVQASAQAEDAAAPEPKALVRDAVDAGNYFFRKAFDERDAQAIAELYTEDGRVIAPGAEPATGRLAIAAFWARSMQETKGVRLETLAVEPAGDLAVEEGVAQLVAADGSETAVRYLVVWKRVGRRWHLHRDIWNTGPLAAPAPADEPRAATPAEAPLAPEEPR